MSYILPLKITIDNQGLLICSENSSIRFNGTIFKANSNAPVQSNVFVKNNTTLVAECSSQTDCVIEDYCYFDGYWQGVEQIVVAKTNLTGIGAFLRTKDISFFLSLDFPYSKIESDDMRVTIGCDPKDNVEKQTQYSAHTLTVGAARLQGEKIGDYYSDEIEAFSEYVVSRMPKNFRGERPIFTSTCITNRMTDARDGRIFYSMYDNPTLTLDIETLKDEVRLCAELGIEYYQVFEDYFNWEEDGSTERNLQQLISLGEQLGVRIGDYMTTIEGCCWHYNYYDRKIGDPSMYALEKSGKRKKLCYGDKRVLPFLRKTILESIKRNREQLICFDGNAAVVCYDENHGHNPGSLYAHIRALTTFMQELNDTSPYFMTWSNAGNWIEFMPKLLWYNPNVYLTDPHPRDYSSSLNMLKYYGDCRREQMVSVHNKYFVPYTAFTNCEYYAFKHSRVSDMSFFEYSFLQGLAVTPNICLGELRTFLERVPAGKLDYVKAFIKKWLSFIRDNIDCWRYTKRLGDLAGAGANEAYSHINNDRGFICFVNQNPYSQKFTFRLNESIGLCQTAQNRWLLSEVYPSEFPLAEQSLPAALYNEQITLTIPAYSVRFIKIEPYDDSAQGIHLYGVKGDLKNTDYYITAECGKPINAALWDNDGNVKDVSVETIKTVPKYYFESSLSQKRLSPNSARFTINMPRDNFNRELSFWKLDEEKEYCFLSHINSDFCGGYIHNLYKENQTVILHTSTDTTTELCEDLTTQCVKTPKKRRASVYECVLDIPFIEWPAMSNEYGYDEVMELVFTDNLIVKSIKAFINENEVFVFQYRYPPKPDMKTFYIELINEVKSGTSSNLRLEIEWNETECRDSYCDKSSGDDAQILGSSKE